MKKNRVEPVCKWA